MIECPLAGMIEIGECVTIVDASEECIKENLLNSNITEKNWKETCKKCKYHEN